MTRRWRSFTRCSPFSQPCFQHLRHHHHRHLHILLLLISSFLDHLGLRLLRYHHYVLVLFSATLLTIFVSLFSCVYLPSVSTLLSLSQLSIYHALYLATFLSCLLGLILLLLLLFLFSLLLNCSFLSLLVQLFKICVSYQKGCHFTSLSLPSHLSLFVIEVELFLIHLSPTTAIVSYAHFFHISWPVIIQICI